MSLSKEEINKIPTILEVLEEIAARENRNTLSLEDMTFIRQTWQEGYYYPIGNIKDRSVQILAPCSNAGLFVYYRGQNQEFIPCKPSLLRLDNEADKIVARVKAEEFKMILLKHPVIFDMQQNEKILINMEALCHHYGFSTQMLDLTNNKWTAAFFATTFWDNEKHQFVPVGSDFAEGYGIFYVSDKPESLVKLFDEARLFPIGYQFLKRPSSQYASGLHLEIDEDFSKLGYFETIRFRHCLKESKIVFGMAYNQKKYYPGDYIVNLANKILNSNKVSAQSVLQVWRSDYPEQDLNFLQDILEEKNIRIEEFKMDVELENNFKEDWIYWCNSGKIRLKNSIVPPILIRYLDE